MAKHPDLAPACGRMVNKRSIPAQVRRKGRNNGWKNRISLHLLRYRPGFLVHLIQDEKISANNGLIQVLRQVAATSACEAYRDHLEAAQRHRLAAIRLLSAAESGASRDELERLHQEDVSAYTALSRAMASFFEVAGKRKAP